MKRYFIILAAALLPFLCPAQTIHWLTFIDTTDENVGDIDKNGREVLYSHFINVVNAALAQKGYKSNIRDIHGDDLSPRKCKEIINSFRCGPDDIVVFYYIGHGTHGEEGGDVWPMMLMGEANANTLIPLKWVHDVLKDKGGRLTASIGMCCNVYQGVARRNAPTFAVNYGNLYLPEHEMNAIQDMFLGHKGDFLLASASPGQSSLGYDTPLGPMDIFTFALVRNFEASAEEGNLDWKTLFDDIAYSTDYITEGSQTPIFKSNLTKSRPAAPAPPAPAPVKVETPKPQAPAATPPASQNASPAPAPAPEQGDLLNALGLALDNLIDTRQSEKARIAQAAELEKIFVPGAVVKVIGQDGNLVVDKSSAEDFIGRLATSRILLKVAPVALEVKAGGVSELKVKEIYKQ